MSRVKFTVISNGTLLIIQTGSADVICVLIVSSDISSFQSDLTSINGDNRVHDILVRLVISLLACISILASLAHLVHCSPIVSLL